MIPDELLPSDEEIERLAFTLGDLENEVAQLKKENARLQKLIRKLDPEILDQKKGVWPWIKRGWTKLRAKSAEKKKEAQKKPSSNPKPRAVDPMDPLHNPHITAEQVKLFYQNQKHKGK